MRHLRSLFHASRRRRPPAWVRILRARAGL